MSSVFLKVMMYLVVAWLLLVSQVCQAGKFWQITDLHLDFDYSASGDVNAMCHQNNSISPDHNVGPAGNYSCDAPYLLVRSILKAMHNLEPEPDFIVWTGDNAPHLYNPQPSLDYITNVTSMVFSQLQSLFPNKQVVAALGNHDSSPADFYPSEAQVDQQDSQYYKYYHEGGFDSQLNGSAEATETFLKCGYYVTEVNTQKGSTLKFISLNTNIYYYNKANVSEDPCDQLAWLNQTISNLGQNEKVYLIAHVPPGSFERDPGASFFNYNGTQNDNELAGQLEKKYVSLVVDPDVHHHIHAHLYGHVHTDSFRLYLSRLGDNEVRGVGFLASSGTPLVGRSTTGVNPGIRLYTFSDEDGSLMDYHQYYLDLDKLNFTPPQLKADDNATKKRRRRDVTPPATTSLNKTSNVKSEEINEPPFESTYKPLLGHEAENTTVNDDTEVKHKKLLGHKGENPTPYDTVENEDKNKIKLGHMGENPTPYDDNNNVTKNNDINDTKDDALIDAIAANFTLLYTATEAFNVDNLTASEMARAFNGMTKESRLFQLYYAHNTANHTQGDGTCSDSCYINQMCTIMHSVIDELNSCRSGRENLQVKIELWDVEKDVAKVKPLVTNTSFSPIPAVPSSPVLTTTTTTTTSTATTTTTKKTTTSTTTQLPARVTAKLNPTTPKRKKLNPHNMPSSINSPHVIQNEEDVKTESTSNGSGQVAGVVLGAAGAIILFVLFGIAMRRYRQRRYRDQEFLLTDSVFRYDGYNQLDDGF